MAIKNIWSLNIDEALVADKIKETSQDNYEIFLPANSQLKDVDLILVNLKKMILKTIQVKGSRTYEPRPKEREKFGRGSSSWFIISKNSIFKQSYRVDFFIFVLHSFVDDGNKKDIKIDFLIVPLEYLKKICLQKTIMKGNKYQFWIWIDSIGKRSYDMKSDIKLSKYLNNWKILK